MSLNMTRIREWRKETAGKTELIKIILKSKINLTLIIVEGIFCYKLGVLSEL